MPESLQKNIEGWKSIMPDYEFIRWDSSRFPRGKILWVDQAFDNHKYAFAADYVRLFALYYFGGIYLDTDIEVLKPFDYFLDLPYFIGQEKTPSGIESATIGFPPQYPLIKQLMDRYEKRSFVKSDGSLDMEPIPFIIRRYIEAQYEYNVIFKKEEFNQDPHKFNVFSADFFSPKRPDNRQIEITENTYSIHHFSGSWVPVEIEEEKKREGFRHKIIKNLLVRRNVIIISNSMYERHLNEKFGLSSNGPLKDVYMSEEDFNAFVKLGENAFLRQLHFINYRESKGFNERDFHPVARIEGTDIELHFVRCFTREQAIESWEEGKSEIGQNKLIFVSCSQLPSRMKDYLICLMINLGITVIKF